MPSYIRTKGARLAVELIQVLKSMSISAAVSEPVRGKNEMIVVPHNRADSAKVPAEWNGYTLIVRPEPYANDTAPRTREEPDDAPA